MRNDWLVVWGRYFLSSPIFGMVGWGTILDRGMFVSMTTCGTFQKVLVPSSERVIIPWILMVGTHEQPPRNSLTHWYWVHASRCFGIQFALTLTLQPSPCELPRTRIRDHHVRLQPVHFQGFFFCRWLEDLVKLSILIQMFEMVLMATTWWNWISQLGTGETGRCITR